jgi:glycosyltransferase involved in cell wall biosynthesis
MSDITIYHVDTEKSWRGGQQQAAYLHSQLQKTEFKSILITNPNSRFSRYCKSNNLPLLEIRMRNELDLLAGYKIAQKIGKKENVILQAHSAHALTICIWVKLFRPKIKIISMRRVDFHIKKNFFSKLKYKTKLVDVHVAISNFIKTIMVEDGVEQSRIKTIYSAIDINKFKNIEKDDSVRRNLGFSADNVLIGTTAALTGHKDIPNFIQAARIAYETNDNLRFVVFGEGKLRRELEVLINKTGLNDVFKLPGFTKDVGKALKSMDIFVMPSKTEGLGTSILDAESVCLPIIGTDAGGIPEAIRHNYNGLIVPRMNADELGRTIISLAKDSKLRQRFAQASLEFVKKFHITENLESYRKLYKSLLEQKL